MTKKQQKRTRSERQARLRIYKSIKRCYKIDLLEVNEYYKDRYMYWYKVLSVLSIKEMKSIFATSYPKTSMFAEKCFQDALTTLLMEKEMGLIE